MKGSQDFAPDPRNAHVLVYLNGSMVPREQAQVSIFDAGFVLGDGVWEGLRLHKGALLFLDAHIDRLFEGAAAIDLDIGLDKAGVIAALRQTVAANDMRDGVHIRLMVTRGLKRTPNQDPRQTVGKATIVIVAEYKEPSPEIMGKGLNLFTSSVRCTPADMFDMRLNSHSRLNLITALIQAIKAGADEALMLDPHGFVSSCNATNFFFVRNGEVCTSTGDYCFHGVTRANVIALCRAHDVPLRLGNFALKDVYCAEEAFVTGTFGGVTPVASIDGRRLAASLAGPVTGRLSRLYAEMKDRNAASG
ncbi:aminotransferase class IV [Alsobacter sp. SYSU M60028]|uniref:Probable branched-chain-amino-acid aminotransferase n=1 Tax=Alsobacter ponti TaxID=2962936 RepID=A0ABT1LAB9_9HYPH|nr:aminotransferase class IV [Alsobacter ponti]MCP8938444.1 aminotransferase class IV [Alsobacter ponti]